ncbi:MAG: hypothetical protein M1825_002436 [Sarcosagium campestre]|nr:MAG: hypothetical protein M1825_002436 [Sarcosagium campestre]
MATPMYARYIPPGTTSSTDQITRNKEDGSSKKRKRHKDRPEVNALKAQIKKPSISLESQAVNGSNEHQRVQENSTAGLAYGVKAAHTTHSYSQIQDTEILDQQEDPSKANHTRKRKNKKSEDDRPISGETRDGARQSKPVELGPDIKALNDIREPDSHTSIRTRYHKSALIAERVKHEETPAQKPGTQSDTKEEIEAGQGLVPLPQPAPVEQAPVKLSYSGLPPWLANPIRVSSAQRISFSNLNLNSRLRGSLKDKGFAETFAIQSVVLPMLLPGPANKENDLCISAPTGSGKTMAYVLPIVESIRSRAMTRLRAVVIVPTRDLVAQARDVLEMCGSGLGLKIGLAVGSKSFKAEQDLLIQKGQRFDGSATTGCRETLGKDRAFMTFEDELQHFPRYVVDYTSKVDVLICTPGRLVEHINSTPGFTLDHVEWLVMDEADRLLNESYQEWLGLVVETLEREKSYEELSAEQQLIRKLRLRTPARKLRKIVLSATLTRDASKLGTLKLRDPKYIVVDSPETADLSREHGNEDGDDNQDVFELPPLLREWAIPVDEEGQKPLYLLQVLRTKILVGPSASSSNPSSSSSSRKPKDRTSATDTSSNSGSDSTSSSDSDSDSGSNSESDSDSISVSDSASSSKATAGLYHPTSKPESSHPLQSILIFTSTNTTAVRLHRLLSHLDRSLSPHLNTLTSTTPTSTRRRTLRQIQSGSSSSSSFSSRGTTSSFTILIASDLVARGMDIPSLTHIINYDIPHSVRSYVHRVGRTARAGRHGDAWSLVASREARWFWNSVARGHQLKRSVKVQRVRIAVEEDLMMGYEDALGALGDEVRGGERAT